MSSSAVQHVERLNPNVAYLCRRAAPPLAPPAGQPQGFGTEPYLHNTLLGEFALSATKRVLPEDAWLPAPLPARRAYRPEGRA